MSSQNPLADRAAGCIVGAFIGDALGVGPHWYYDLQEQRRDFGPWIDGYTAPKPGRYHEGLKPGELSQTGIIMKMLLESTVQSGGYDEADFCARLDRDFLPKLDGTPKAGPGGYTNHSFRQVWQARVRDGKPWGRTAGNADTSEGAERLAIIAGRHAADGLRTVASHANRCCLLAQNDSLVVQESVAFALVLAALIRGEKLDGEISDKLMEPVRSGELPFIGEKTNDPEFGFASPDALLLPSWCAEAARDPGIRIEPAWKVSIVYGMSCAIPFVLPAAYYLAARFPDDFEGAVLHALNGGGQNMSRALLTGALAGAQAGLSGIPARFVEGLRDGAEIARLATQAAEASTAK